VSRLFDYQHSKEDVDLTFQCHRLTGIPQLSGTHEVIQCSAVQLVLVGADTV